MSKTLSAAILFLISSPLYAAMNDMDAASAPAETVSMVWVVVFGILFVGMIVGFFVYLWWNERKQKPSE